MRRYRFYHTVIKQLVKRNSLPEEFVIQIDRSTLWRWKQEATDRYFGVELSNIELLEQFLNRREAGKVMRTYLRVASSLSCILNKSLQLRNILKANRTQFVNIFTGCKNKLIIKLILRLCKVSLSLFYFWKSKVLNKCLTSPVQLCRKRYPEQLTCKEVMEMKSMLTDVKYRFWPVSSIAYYALRENIISVSLATWYLYKRKLSIDRMPVPKKEKYSTGLRASYPDQIWHADITIVKTLDGMKYYIYLLMDNFSRFILSWRIEEVVSGRIRVETIREAFKKYHDKNIRTPLITDGGPENDNNEMDRFILNEATGFAFAVALKDIPFSNSMIEAQNKLFKYRYLFRQEYATGDDLKRVFAEDLFDYNIRRPHVSLRGYTPGEAYSGLSDMEMIWSNQIRQAKRDRLAVNRMEVCSLCQ